MVCWYLPKGVVKPFRPLVRPMLFSVAGDDGAGFDATRTRLESTRQTNQFSCHGSRFKPSSRLPCNWHKFE